MNELKNLARERIRLLFDQAESSFAKHSERSHRYVKIARAIAMKARYRMPWELKKKFCKRCHHFLVIGKNARLRIKDKKRILHCLDCGNVMRKQIAGKRHDSFFVTSF